MSENPRSFSNPSRSDDRRHLTEFLLLFDDAAMVELLASDSDDQPFVIFFGQNAKNRSEEPGDLVRLVIVVAVVVEEENRVVLVEENLSLKIVEKSNRSNRTFKLNENAVERRKLIVGQRIAVQTF